MAKLSPAASAALWTIQVDGGFNPTTGQTAKGRMIAAKALAELRKKSALTMDAAGLLQPTYPREVV